MAGRRRRGVAAASALNLLGELMLEERRSGRDRQEKAQELEQEFKIDLAKSRAKKGLDYKDPFTGEDVAGTGVGEDLGFMDKFILATNPQLAAQMGISLGGGALGAPSALGEPGPLQTGGALSATPIPAQGQPTGATGALPATGALTPPVTTTPRALPAPQAVPTKFSPTGFSGTLDPTGAVAAQQEATKKLTVDQQTQAEAFKSGARALGSILISSVKALPPTSDIRIVQRTLGPLVASFAKAGIGGNISTQPFIEQMDFAMRDIANMSGIDSRLTEPARKALRAALEDQGRTLDERLSASGQFLSRGLAKLAPSVREIVLQDPEISLLVEVTGATGLLKGLGEIKSTKSAKTGITVGGTVTLPDGSTAKIKRILR